jgi:hypothetical protein
MHSHILPEITFLTFFPEKRRGEEKKREEKRRE